MRSWDIGIYIYTRIIYIYDIRVSKMMEVNSANLEAHGVCMDHAEIWRAKRVKSTCDGRSYDTKTNKKIDVFQFIGLVFLVKPLRKMVVQKG